MKRFALSLIFLLVFGCAWGQQLRKMLLKDGNSYCLIMDENGVGVSKDDVVIIPTERGYSSCEYEKGYYVFSKDGLYGLADRVGEEVVPRYYSELSFVSRDSVLAVTESRDTTILGIGALLEQAKVRYGKIEAAKFPGKVFHEAIGYYTETVDGYIRVVGVNGEVVVSDVFGAPNGKSVRTKAVSYAGRHNGDCFVVYGDDDDDDDSIYLTLQGDPEYKRILLFGVDEVKPYDYNEYLALKIISHSSGASVAVLREESDYAYVQKSDQYKDISDFMLINGNFHAVTVTGEMFDTQVGLTLPPVSGQIKPEMPTSLQKLLSYNLGDIFTESLARQGYLDAIRLYVRQNTFKYCEYDVCLDIHTVVQMLELSYRHSTDCLFMYACILSGCLSEESHQYVDKERARELFRQYLSLLDTIDESDYPWGQSKSGLLYIIESRFPELLTE